MEWQGCPSILLILAHPVNTLWNGVSKKANLGEINCACVCTLVFSHADTLGFIAKDLDFIQVISKSHLHVWLVIRVSSFWGPDLKPSFSTWILMLLSTVHLSTQKWLCGTCYEPESILSRQLQTQHGQQDSDCLQTADHLMKICQHSNLLREI